MSFHARPCTIRLAALAMLSSMAVDAFAGPSACAVAGNVATCQGDQSAGVASGADFSTPPVDTVNVNGLTANIVPAPGVSGIVIQDSSNGSLSVNSDTGAFGIVTQGFASGILAANTSAGDVGGITIASIGDISTGSLGGFGIGALLFAGGEAGAVSVTSAGDIVIGDLSAGIFVSVFASGDSGPVSVTSAGDITSEGPSAGAGIAAVNLAGGATGRMTIVSTGDIAVAQRAMTLGKTWRLRTISRPQKTPRGMIAIIPAHLWLDRV